MALPFYLPRLMKENGALKGDQFSRVIVVTMLSEGIFLRGPVKIRRRIQMGVCVCALSIQTGVRGWSRGANACCSARLLLRLFVRVGGRETGTWERGRDTRRAKRNKNWGRLVLSFLSMTGNQTIDVDHN